MDKTLTNPQSVEHKSHPKSKFSKEEDALLCKLINEIGTNHWDIVASKMPNRNIRQCKERWNNYLSPDIKILPWTPEEDLLLQKKFHEFGAKWVKISHFFPHRTDINVKNRWLVLCRKSKKGTIDTKQFKSKEFLKSVSSGCPLVTNEAYSNRYGINHPFPGSNLITSQYFSPLQFQNFNNKPQELNFAHPNILNPTKNEGNLIFNSNSFVSVQK